MSNHAAWYGSRLICRGDVYAVVRQGYGGRQVGIWDAEGVMSRDGVPRLDWSLAEPRELARLCADLNAGWSRFVPIPAWHDEGGEHAYARDSRFDCRICRWSSARQRDFDLRADPQVYQPISDAKTAHMMALGYRFDPCLDLWVMSHRHYVLGGDLDLADSVDADDNGAMYAVLSCAPAPAALFWLMEPNKEVA